MKQICVHSWKYHSDITRECVKCKLFQRRIWINISNLKTNKPTTCKVCKKKFPSKITTEEHIDKEHRI